MTLTQNGVVDKVNFDANGTYRFDGERMVLINWSLGAHGSAYRTEQSVLLKATTKGNTPDFASPLWFEVITKVELTMEYGQTIQSRIEAQGTNNIKFRYVGTIIGRNEILPEGPKILSPTKELELSS